jgi:hypothetical protein
MNTTDTCLFKHEDFRDKWILSHHLLPMIYTFYGTNPTLVLLGAFIFETVVEAYPNYCTTIPDGDMFRFEDPSNMTIVDPIIAFLSITFVYICTRKFQPIKYLNNISDIKFNDFLWFIYLSIPTILLLDNWVENYSFQYIFITLLCINTIIVFRHKYSTSDYGINALLILVLLYEVILFLLIEFVDYNHFFLMIYYHLLVFIGIAFLRIVINKDITHYRHVVKLNNNNEN